MNRILIADDHEVTRRGVAEILRETFAVEVGEASDGAGALAMLDGQAWDMLLVDVMMPGMSLVELLRAVRRTRPTLPLLVLTAATEIEYVVEALKNGANGLVYKSQASDVLCDAVRTVLAGRTYLQPDLAAQLASATGTAAKELPHSRLSRRELEIFQWIARGHTVKEIAVDLGLSDKTVATYLTRIREKTGISSHVEIARYALHHRLVD